MQRIFLMFFFFSNTVLVTYTNFLNENVNIFFSSFVKMKYLINEVKLLVGVGVSHCLMYEVQSTNTATEDVQKTRLRR